jgi:hypothetical protein
MTDGPKPTAAPPDPDANRGGGAPDLNETEQAGRCRRGKLRDELVGVRAGLGSCQRELDHLKDNSWSLGDFLPSK